MKTELQELREEISKLRERVAVLESQPKYIPMPAPVLLPPAVSPWSIPGPSWCGPHVAGRTYSTSYEKPQ